MGAREGLCATVSSLTQNKEEDLLERSEYNFRYGVQEPASKGLFSPR